MGFWVWCLSEVNWLRSYCSHLQPPQMYDKLCIWEEINMLQDAKLLQLLGLSWLGFSSVRWNENESKSKPKPYPSHAFTIVQDEGQWNKKWWGRPRWFLKRLWLHLHSSSPAAAVGLRAYLEDKGRREGHSLHQKKQEHWQMWIATKTQTSSNNKWMDLNDNREE